jgi:molybdate transport system regulatory protein
VAEGLGLEARLWLTSGGTSLGGAGRLALLQAIAEQGSITAAAKAVGMSYKAAWEAVDTMNNLAGQALVARQTGGRGGGSTRLTEHGQQLVARFAALTALHQRFVEQLSLEGTEINAEWDVLRTLTMKTSARNQFAGTVVALRAGAVNDEVELQLPGGARIVAMVSSESSEQLGLQVGMAAFALIQSSSVLLARELGAARLSARNQLAGIVRSVTPGAVNAEVVIELDASTAGSLAATVTQASLQDMGLQPGVPVVALFKASSVIIGVMA